jgi:hypothetical protein
MKSQGDKSLLHFLFIAIVFGGAGLFNLFVLSLFKPRWARLFLPVVRYFALLPISLIKRPKSTD